MNISNTEVTSRQPLNTYQPAHNRGGGHFNNHYQQGNQLQQLFNLLIPILQLLISQFDNKDCPDQCNKEKNLQLSDEDNSKLFDALFPPGTNFPGGNVPDISSVTDKDCDGAISVGDEVTTITGTGAIDDQGREISRTDTFKLTQEVIDRFNNS